MSRFIAERTNAEDTTVKLYTMRGDRRAQRARYTIELAEGETFEQKLDELGLEMVGRWMRCRHLGTDKPDTEVVDVFPKM